MEGWTTGNTSYVATRFGKSLVDSTRSRLVKIGSGRFGKVCAADWIDGKYVGIGSSQEVNAILGTAALRV